jgi:hypothetical protein
MLPTVSRLRRIIYFYMQVFYHSSVEELGSVQRDIIKSRVVPAAVQHWERVFKVRAPGNLK